MVKIQDNTGKDTSPVLRCTVSIDKRHVHTCITSYQPSAGLKVAITGAGLWNLLPLNTVQPEERKGSPVF